ncbi:unnamed protein product [Spirodela intermedia]|uniref:Uncharacterized protein n=1 Tax=Spirodela intermedia TaxID=51605 RepID=A0A7I8J1L3_SPIIN|nr:unnamed protein product [Spirodela intermedia]CAA6663210.1 unnamed protein product [Spirodela intermedia]
MELLMKGLVLYLSLSSSLSPATAGAAEEQVAPSVGTIKRLTKQDILASIPPGEEPGERPFITSLAGKYSAYLVRSATAPGAGGFGNDFCYVQVRGGGNGGTGQSVWESPCAPASVENTCSLVFTAAGLEVFDGSRSAWDTGVEERHLETLELAADYPLANQQCGAPGSPGLAAARPPFASPIGDGGTSPSASRRRVTSRSSPAPAPAPALAGRSLW